MKNSLIIDYYKDFKCIADRCSFFCCKGWDISIDSDTYDRWNKDEEQSNYLCKNVKFIKEKKKKQAYIKMTGQKICPFLNEIGLCNIVLNCGEDYLSTTCKTFPRLDNSYGSEHEHSLSFACPEVVDIINRRMDDIDFIMEGNIDIIDTLPIELKIRERMISILQNKKYSLRIRLLLTFYMLLTLKEEQMTAEEVLQRYLDEKYCSALVDYWSGIEISEEDSLIEVNELFIDITQNYRKEFNYKKYLEEISHVAETLDLKNEQTLKSKIGIHKEYKKYDKLLENCFVSKVFASCVKKDIDEMIVSYQMLLTEFIMIKHSIYLKYKKSYMENIGIYNKQQLPIQEEEINYNDIRDYIVIYSRIIGYNTDGIREFWEESFDEAVWEFGYLLLLLN